MHQISSRFWTTWIAILVIGALFMLDLPRKRNGFPPKPRLWMLMVAVVFVAVGTTMCTQYLRSSRWAMSAQVKAAMHEYQAEVSRSLSQRRAKLAQDYADKARGSEPGRQLVEYWRA